MVAGAEDSTALNFVRAAFEVAVAALAVLATIWRIVDGMISKKVKLQVQEAMKEVTKETSEQIASLRTVISENHSDQTKRIDDRFDALTTRIDKFFRGG